MPLVPLVPLVPLPPLVSLAALVTAQPSPVQLGLLQSLGRPGHAWTVEENGWVVRETIAIFGPRRAMFASNFPVDGLCADFGTIFSVFKAATKDRPPAERLALFHDNAASWRLRCSPGPRCPRR